MATLVDAPTITTHPVFVGSKAPWFTITNGLQFEEHDVAS